MSMFTSSSPGIVAGAENQGAGLVTVVSKATWGDTVDASSWVSNSVTTVNGALYLFFVTHCITTGPITNISSITGPCITVPNRIRVQPYSSNTQQIELFVAKGNGASGVVTVAFPSTRIGCQVQMLECANVNLALGTAFGGVTFGLIQNQGISNQFAYTSYPQLVMSAFANANNATVFAFGADMVPVGWDPPGANPPLLVLREASIITPNSTLGVAWSSIPTTNPVMTPTRPASYQEAAIGIELASV